MYDASQTRTARAIRMVLHEGLSKSEAARRVGIVPEALTKPLRAMGIKGLSPAGKQAIREAARRRAGQFREDHAERATKALAMVRAGSPTQIAADRCGISINYVRKLMQEHDVLPPREVSHNDIKRMALAYFAKLDHPPESESEVIAYQHYIDGKSYTMIAEDRGLTRNTIAGLVHRFRKRMERHVAHQNGNAT